MKKWLATLCASIMLVVMTAGGGFGTEANAASPAEKKTEILVAYFSATGVTKALAEHAADAMGADLYEIVPEIPYTAADLNYRNTGSRSSIENSNASVRPAILGRVENMDQYRIVFLGYPIWWGHAPRIVQTFMEAYDFSGKTIVPFCTSGGSALGSSARSLHELAASDATWLEGERLDRRASRETVVNWINGLGLGVTAR